MSTLAQAQSLEEFIYDHPEIIIDHQDSWERYPKYKWIYETTRLLDMQSIPWSIYNDQYVLDSTLLNTCVTLNMFNMGEPNNLEQTNYLWSQCPYYHNRVYVNQFEGDEITTTVAIFKGEIKWIKQYQWEPKNQYVIDDAIILPSICGDIRLRINALVNLHFKKFSGTIAAQSCGKDIYGVRLYLTVDEYTKFFLDDPQLQKHIIRIYNNRPWGK